MPVSCWACSQSMFNLFNVKSLGPTVPTVLPHTSCVPNGTLVPMAHRALVKSSAL